MADHDLAIISRIIIFLSSLSTVSLMIQAVSGVAFISIGALGWFSTTTAITAGVCVLATGIPCALALGLSSALSFLSIIVDVPIISSLVNSSAFPLVTTLILTPISLILTIFIAKLARGN
jgi:hypothetical protein